MQVETKQVILKQIQDNKPKVVRKAFESLIQDYYTYQEALEKIGQIYEMVDHKNYLKELKKLTYDHQNGLFALYSWIQREESEYDEDIRKKILRIYQVVKDELWSEMSNFSALDLIDEEVFPDLFIADVIQAIADICNEYHENKLAVELFDRALNSLYFDDCQAIEYSFDALRAMEYVRLGLTEEVEYEKKQLTKMKKKEPENAWPWIKEFYMLIAEDNNKKKVDRYLEKVYPLLIKDQFNIGNEVLAEHVMNIFEDIDTEKYNNVKEYYDSLVEEREEELYGFSSDEDMYDGDEFDYDENLVPLINIEQMTKACKTLDFSILDDDTLFHLGRIFDMTYHSIDQMIEREIEMQGIIKQIEEYGFRNEEVRVILSMIIVLYTGENLDKEMEQLNVGNAFFIAVHQGREYLDQLLYLYRTYFIYF